MPLSHARVVPLDLAKLRELRSLVSASVPDCRAALERFEGDVRRAALSLMTEEERVRAATWTAKPKDMTKRAAPGEAAAPPKSLARELSPERVLVELAVALRRHARWRVGPPASRAMLSDLLREHLRRFECPPDAVYLDFLAARNGMDDGEDARLYSCDAPERWSAPSGGLPVGELRQRGVLLLRDPRPGRTSELWFAPRGDGPAACRVSHDFPSFLRDLLDHDLDLAALVRGRLAG